MDAITLLRNDHETVEGLFKRFEQAGDNAQETKREIVDRIIEELSVHASIEELVFYPAVREAVADAKDHILEALEEHHIVKWTLSELEDMGPEEERFDAKVKVLIEAVRHHVEEEQDELFPKVLDALGDQPLEQLGADLEAAKKTAPTRPHPKAPDTPPGNTIVSTVSGVIDRAHRAGQVAVGRATGSGGRKSSGGAKKAVKKSAGSAKSPARKATAKKAVKKSAGSAKSPARKTPAKKAVKKSAGSAKSPARKTPAKKSPAKKATAKKSPAKKATAKKSPAKKATARKTPAKKSTSRR